MSDPDFGFCCPRDMKFCKFAGIRSDFGRTAASDANWAYGEDGTPLTEHPHTSHSMVKLRGLTFVRVTVNPITDVMTMEGNGKQCTLAMGLEGGGKYLFAMEMGGHVDIRGDVTWRGVAWRGVAWCGVA